MPSEGVKPMNWFSADSLYTFLVDNAADLGWKALPVILSNPAAAWNDVKNVWMYHWKMHLAQVSIANMLLLGHSQHLTYAKELLAVMEQDKLAPSHVYVFDSQLYMYDLPAGDIEPVFVVVHPKDSRLLYAYVDGQVVKFDEAAGQGGVALQVLNHIIRSCALIHYIYTLGSAAWLMPLCYTQALRKMKSVHHPILPIIKYLNDSVVNKLKACEMELDRLEGYPSRSQIEAFIRADPKRFLDITGMLQARGVCSDNRANAFHRTAMRTKKVIDSSIQQLMVTANMTTTQNIEFRVWADNCYMELGITPSRELRFSGLELLANLIHLAASYELGPWFLYCDRDLPHSDLIQVVMKSWNWPLNSKPPALPDRPEYFDTLFEQITELYEQDSQVAVQQLTPFAF